MSPPDENEPGFLPGPSAAGKKVPGVEPAADEGSGIPLPPGAQPGAFGTPGLPGVPEPAEVPGFGPHGLDLGAQIDGTEGGFTLPAGVSPDGYAFALSTGEWFVRSHSASCAGGFAAGEHWPWPTGQWPANFSLALTLSSVPTPMGSRWLAYGDPMPGQGGPSAQAATYYRNDDRPHPDGPKPAANYHEVRKNGVLTHWVEPTQSGGKWTHKLGTDASLALGQNDGLAFRKV